MPFRIIGIGEILWDVFPDGSRFGGAPANFACSAAELGQAAAAVALVSAVGADPLGVAAIEALHVRGVDTRAVQTHSSPTGRVDVELNSDGSARYRFASDSAWDHLIWSPRLQGLAATCDAVCFGTLGQRHAESRATIRQFIGATPPAALRILDVNLRAPFDNDEVILASLELANVLKLNDEELPRVAGMSGFSGSDRELLQQLLQKYRLHCIALTRGAAGALVMSRDSISDLPGKKVEVVDTVGAGDAFTASLTLDLLAGQDLATANQNAIATASYVCSQPGATMPLPRWAGPMGDASR